MIIGFCGYARAGKDTCANLILNNSHINVTKSKIGFADALRDFAWELNSFFPEINKHYRDIVQEYGYDRAKTEFPFIREYLVKIGNGARLNISNKIWINAVKYKIRDNPAGLHLISDVRYPNEVDFILSKGGMIIYVERPGVYAANPVEENSIQEILARYDIRKVNNYSNEEHLNRQLLNILFQIKY